VHAGGGQDEVYWFVAHVDKSIITWSSNPALVPLTAPPLGPSVQQLPEIESVDDGRLEEVATMIARADSVLVMAGAGCSMDSGLPDFRGRGGWYRLGDADVSMDHIDFHPGSVHLRTAWTLAASMVAAFQEHAPHNGYTSLVAALFPQRLQPTARRQRGFVVTSNIDGYFSRAGVPDQALFEAHGCVENLQCTTVGTEAPCAHSNRIWPLDSGAAERLDAVRTKAADFMGAAPDADWRDCLPRCSCGALARPNITHATDVDEDLCEERKGAQRTAMLEWLSAERRAKSFLVVLEVGCGTSYHSLRGDSEATVARHRSGGGRASLVRIDPGDPAVPLGETGLRLPAREALARLFFATTERSASLQQGK